MRDTPEQPEQNITPPTGAPPESAAMPATRPPTKARAKPGVKAGAKAGAKSGSRPKASAKKAQARNASVMSAAEPSEIDPRRLQQQMERQMLAVTRLLQEHDFATDEEANAFLQQLMEQGGQIGLAPLTPLDEAQELIYQAMDAKGKRREKLARQALAISPDCADAYVLLAESTRDPQEARQFFEEGMRAGERALGDLFAQLAADKAFWSYVESRPYMRARQGLADVLWATDERQEAIGHLQEMLRLNPNDNQGVRYILISWLLTVGDDKSLKAVEKLLRQFNEESATWAYSRLLLTLRRKGHGRAAENALLQAMAANPFVPFYLLGVLSLPKQAPEVYGIGDENEAIMYLDEGGAEAWLQNEQHIIWLAETLMRLAPPELQEGPAARESEIIPMPGSRGRPRKRK